MQKAVLFLLLTITLFTSCEERFTQVVDLEIPPHDPRLVTYSIIDASQDSIFVEVSKSLDITEDADPVITDALIRFSKNETLITDDFELIKRFVDLDWSTNQLDSIFDYKYKAKTGEVFTAGNNYSLSISAIGLESVEAEAMVPEKVSIEEIEFTKDGIIDPEGYKSDELKLTFSDPGEEENYYLVAVRMKDKFDEELYENDVYISAFDPRINQSSWGTPIIKNINSYAYFDDKEGINGNKNTLRFSMNLYFDPDNPDIKISVKLFTLSKDLYNFCHALNQYSNSEGVFFAEPVTIPSNFENGFGVFGFYDYTEKYLEL
jgi:hypothetical protein